MHKLDIELYSTGGTYSHIESLGLPVKKVEDLTSYPSILGGRVKTLHPKVFGGILGRRDEKGDLAEMAEYGIPEIDIVVVDLYPFEETVASGGDEAAIIEKIDIGGISLIRAAAKNHKDVLIVPNRESYADAERILVENKGNTSLEDRKSFAVRAFGVSTSYDHAIHNWMGGSKELRYGENPHQKARFVGKLEDAFTQLHGKELSYNNLLDVDSAWWLMDEFVQPTCAVIKHNNACGLASRDTLAEAWDAALEADPVSAFGGILACNRKVDAATATKMNELFFEVLLAPSYEEEALEILRSKKKRILLETKKISRPREQYRSILNGLLEQESDNHTDNHRDLTVVTKKAPSSSQIDDLLFASKVSKHTRSNTIVLAKDQRLIGSGTGQTSRVDALRHAIAKAKAFGLDIKGAAMASDAFFPFPDCVEIAHEAGIESVIQPGGSIKDQLSIDYCDENNMSMVFTGYRHFKH
jgi:phosphoribosylaminoimidazolecarboxamide formyltransferase/IMP cyclohydrolase